MGKRLIIYGADFSQNGIQQEIDVTPENYNRKGINLAHTSVSTSGATDFAVWLLPVEIGKKYLVQFYGSYHQYIWGLNWTQQQYEAGIQNDSTPDITYEHGASSTKEIQQKELTATTPYLAFSSYLGKNEENKPVAKIWKVD